MKTLLHKELRLALHPTAPLFLCLSAMLMIPNYPYYVVFFYTSLAVFFICLTGRENHDVFYSVLLPIGKTDVVKARFATVVLLELLQVVLAIPFAVLRQQLNPAPNEAGMDANIALFGIALVLLGLFNLVFFGLYYKDVQKVGKSFGISCVVTFVGIGLAETCTFILPFFRDQLDTRDPLYPPQKLIVLAAGILLFCLLTGLAYRRAKRDFQAQDL